MKKAPWLQLPRFRSLEPLPPAADELGPYRRRRFVHWRRPERTEEERSYHTRVREWLQQSENRWCRVYQLLAGRRVRASQCHHYQGRRGMLLRYEPFWIPVSWEGHCWINDHRQRARELGLLCPLGKYNSPVQTAGDSNAARA